MAARNILVMWVDDEIEFLRPHQLFLAERGYEVIPMTKGRTPSCISNRTW